MKKALLLTLALPAAAMAAETYSATDLTIPGWGPSLSEIARSLDIVGFGLLTCFAILLGMFLDLLNHLRINKLIPEAMLAEVQEEMANGEYERALEICEKSDCLIGQVFAAALSKTDYSFERMQEALRSELAIQALFWRQWVGQFRVTAVAGFLLGLMGASLHAMRFVFDLTGRPNVGLALAASFEMRAVMYNVFVAVFVGSAMSLLSLVAYSVCASKLEKIIKEAERLGEELLDPFRPLPIPSEE